MRHFSRIAAPVVAGYHPNAEAREQSQQFRARFIVLRPERISQNAACFGVMGIPEPVLDGFAADNTPLLIKFTDKGDTA